MGDEGLSPGGYTSLAGKISAVEEQGLNFINHSWRNSERQTSCDDYCLRDIYCESITIDPARYHECYGTPYYDWKNDFFGTLR